jgi:hypothetical protein
MCLHIEACFFGMFPLELNCHAERKSRLCCQRDPRWKSHVEVNQSTLEEFSIEKKAT